MISLIDVGNCRDEPTRPRLFHKNWIIAHYYKYTCADEVQTQQGVVPPGVVVVVIIRPISHSPFADGAYQSQRIILWPLTRRIQKLAPSIAIIAPPSPFPCTIEPANRGLEPVLNRVALSLAPFLNGLLWIR